MSHPEPLPPRHFDFREDWPPGPWDSEPDRVEWRDEQTGLPCLIVRGPVGALCGYVAVPPGHPWHGKGYDEVDASAHGGLTYADKCGGHICHVPAPGEPDDVWWLGFDCGHGGDITPSMAGFYAKTKQRDPFPRLYPNYAYRTVDYVRSECAELAAQVAQVAEAAR